MFTPIIIGTLSTVSEVTAIQVNSSTIELSYNAPPTLIGIPISNYSIYTSSNNETIWTTKENLQLTINDSCTNHTIEIAAWNSVGKGDTYYLPLIINDGMYNMCSNKKPF